MRLKVFAVLAASLMLCGCFDIQQNFKFADDGTVKVAMRLGLDASLVGMLESDEDGEPFCSEGDVEGAQESGLRVTAKRSTEGSNVICAFEVEGPAAVVLEKLNSGDLIPGEKAEDGPQMTVDLTRENDDLVFLVSIPPFGSEETDDPMAEGMEKMFLASMTGRMLSWSITAPNIVKTTGTLSPDKNTASFSVPLAEAFTNKSTTYEFRTAFQVSNPDLFFVTKSATK